MNLEKILIIGLIAIPAAFFALNYGSNIMGTFGDNAGQTNEASEDLMGLGNDIGG